MSGNETDTVCYLEGVDFCAVHDEHQSVSDDNVDAEFEHEDCGVYSG